MCVVVWLVAWGAGGSKPYTLNRWGRRLLWPIQDLRVGAEPRQRKRFETPIQLFEA